MSKAKERSHLDELEALARKAGVAVTSAWFRGQALGLEANVKLWVPAYH